MSETPVTKGGLAKFDHLSAEQAVRRAWNDQGVRPSWHEKMKKEVRRSMPLLARALDRL